MMRIKQVIFIVTSAGLSVASVVLFVSWSSVFANLTPLPSTEPEFYSSGRNGVKACSPDSAKALKPHVVCEGTPTHDIPANARPVTVPGKLVERLSGIWP